ncbi:MAG: RNA polymerase factor sigma-54 [Myxococcota bacterium]|jgi:RNA polymerase sigma-54 factor|nr:RNA polymerase factor sigma-54 [Myxococcota bacterium]
MAIELKQQLKMQQTLVMTPQLQQAIKLLQLNQLELVSLVQEELQENPCLDEEDREEATDAEIRDETPESLGEQDRAADSGEASAGDGEEEGRELGALEMASDLSGEESSDAAAESGESDSPTDADKIADVQWDDYMDSHPLTGLEGRAPGDDDGRPSIEATLSRAPNLAEHLSWQIQLSDFDAFEVAIAEWIIGNLDEKGYLIATVEEVAGQANVEAERVTAVLAKVQNLDPVGVAARDLRECLLIQIHANGNMGPWVLSIVEDHIDLLQKRDLKKIARSLEAPIEEVSVAVREIAGLEPRPARAFGGDEPVYIIPDIYVYKVAGEFHIQLNEEGLPRLKINNVYKNVLATDSSSGSESRETKNYVQDKVRAALWLIKSIHQRQRTIYKVTESIIGYQRDFFESGVSSLKPLNLRDVAEDIEMHESTVSRVTTNKYMHTPQGIFELKYFFNSSISRVEGDAVASESVKEEIRKLVASENPSKPLSDQKIVEELKSINIDIARRTVTKYRESLNILSSTKRREVG